MAARLGVRPSTFSEWKSLHAELAEAIKKGRDKYISSGIDAIEALAIVRATGYMVAESETVTEAGPKGSITRTKAMLCHVPADPTLAIWLLSTHRGDIYPRLEAQGKGRSRSRGWRPCSRMHPQTSRSSRVPMGFEFGRISPKAYNSIKDCNARINLWHGAVRSGKTISSIIAWGLHMSTRPRDGLYMMVSKTSKALERNCVLPLMDIFGASNCAHIPSQAKLYFLGRRIDLLDANDSGSASRIQGSTVTDAYGDELTTWPEAVFAMLMSRLSVPGARFYGTTNPDGPSHWLKKSYIDRASELNLKRWSFGLEDNLALPAEYKEAIRREYTWLWYRRYALVERYLAIDYGTVNPFVCLDIRLHDEKLVVVFEWRWDNAERRRQMTDAEYADQVMRLSDSGAAVSSVIVDPSAASFILELRRRGMHVRSADNEVLEGIRKASTLIADRRLLIARESCPYTIQELTDYRWDSKAAVMGMERPLKQNDHGADALRYAVSTLWLKTASGTLMAYKKVETRRIMIY